MFMFVLFAFFGYCVALLVEKRRAVLRGKKTMKSGKSAEYKYQNSSYERPRQSSKKEDKPHMKYVRTHTWDLISLLILFISFVIYVISYASVYTSYKPYSNH